ncbi:nitroreductase family protein [Streptomyces murinus]|uniref:nitroreductase n=1 Tax=Streptomyces murinus TaxID=33900 RepID=UPI0036E43C6A
MTTIPSARETADQVATAIRTRRSTIRLTGPAPGPHELLDLLAAAPTADLAEKIIAKHVRAPLILALVFQPRDHPTIPRWEQLAATSAMATTLLLLLGGIWYGGPYPDAPQVRKHLGVGDGEQLLGYLYIGTPIPGEEPRTRVTADVRPKITWLGDTAL